MRNMFTGMEMGETEIEKSRRLADIALREISLVDKPATKKKFLFFKSDDGDELDMLLSVLEQAEFDSESDTAITKALGILTALESDARTAIAKTIMAVVQLAGVDIDDETEGIRKIDYDSLKWPSFSSPHRKVEKAEVSGDELWPSLC